LPRATGSPSTRIAPREAGTRPRIARISVVLPAPFGPSTPMNSPWFTAKLASRRIVRSPSVSVTPASVSTGCGAR
jgi:hypothetical protein